MPELRHDPVMDKLVLVAPERAARPMTVRAPETRAEAPRDCPFCPGNEADTPPETGRIGPGAPGTPGWRARAFPNLYPIVGGPGTRAGATGAHEVIALSPDHNASFAQLELDQATDALALLRDRSSYHASRHSYTHVFVNQGRDAGASIEHPHAQLVALDFVPPAVEALTGRFAGDNDPLAVDLEQARAADLAISDTEVSAAWCPFAGIAPYEVRVAVRGAPPRFELTNNVALRSFALALRDVLSRTVAAIGDVPYNVVVHSFPQNVSDDLHWFATVRPRTTIVAGFELGTGVLVNPVAPEHAARHLREAAAA